MMLSVLIVNYNVRYFLEYCLLSVIASARYMQASHGHWQTEILVIDNGSTDGSMEALPAAFPSVNFINAGENLGFGKANNRLISMAKGRYLLFLNPDTLLPEHCLLAHISFLESREDVGASGIRMIDGSGRFLPESKRGFPGSWNSFTKMSGLAALFPRSRFFAGYYEGHLPDNKSAGVPVLSGAYMLVRSEVLQKTGGFDERFFMYAEDIDLSYRINLSGNITYYFADVTVVHFKGESTDKDAAYVIRFYTAMVQFVEKHFSRGAVLYVTFLKLMIKIKTKAAAFKARAKPGQAEFHKLLWVKGDGDQLNKLLALFKGKYLCNMEAPSQRYTLTEGPVEKDQIHNMDLLFCVGGNYHFRDLIGALGKSKDVGNKIFHPDATAIVGSDSKSTKGTVIRLHSCP
jgi:N-acetylglucosaminyl-diphospho-decaprenol L-rhamnosyltransferase